MKNLNDFSDWLDINEHQKLGEILMQSGKLSLSDLGMALDVQNFEKMQLGTILINMKVLTEEELNKALQIQKQIDDMISARRS